MKEGYKNTDVGVIPEDWEVKRLEEISNIIMGQSPNSDSYNDDKIGVPFFQGNSEFGRINPTVKKWCSEPIKIVEPLDILISVRAPVGAVNINTYRSCIGRGLGAIRANYDTNYKYLFYVMANSRNVLNSSAQGSTFTAINSGDLKNHKVAIPPLKEQEKIAEILSTVDCQIDDTEKLIEKCRVLKKGLMQRLLTKGIGHSEFKKSEVGEIPVGWEVKKLGDIVNSERKITYGIVQPGEYDENGVYLIKAGDYSNGWAEVDTLFKVSNEIENKYSRSRLKENDILFTIVGSVGNVALVPEHLEGANLTQQTARISINKNIGDSIYYYYLVQGNLFKMNTNKFLKTGVQPSINLSDLEIFKVPVPPVEEQKKIAKILSSVDRNIKEYDNKKQRLEELKKGLMQQLLTGKIRTI